MSYYDEVLLTIDRRVLASLAVTDEPLPPEVIAMALGYTPLSVHLVLERLISLGIVRRNYAGSYRCMNRSRALGWLRVNAPDLLPPAWR